VKIDGPQEQGDAARAAPGESVPQDGFRGARWVQGKSVHATREERSFALRLPFCRDRQTDMRASPSRTRRVAVGAARRWHAQITKEEYGRLGSAALGERLALQLRARGKNPYVIPVGGSNALGTWGYLEAVHELQQQQQSSGRAFTDIAMVRLPVCLSVCPSIRQRASVRPSGSASTDIVMVRLLLSCVRPSVCLSVPDLFRDGGSLVGNVGHGAGLGWQCLGLCNCMWLLVVRQWLLSFGGSGWCQIGACVNGIRILLVSMVLGCRPAAHGLSGVRTMFEWF
jgi:hypothetical protein